MPKNIVILADGTGQEGGEGASTNIYKLFNMIEDRTPNQISYYDRGLGTGWRKVSGNLFGIGFSKNIKDCYSFIFQNYEAGDNIYLFGFSRGAAMMRSLSSFIHYFGILPQSRPELIDKAYKIYKIEDLNKRKEKADEFIQSHHTQWTKIRFIGCFDTVSALGLPIKWVDVIINKMPIFKHNFHSFKLSKTVEYAYHALAIDDERENFHPVLWESEVEDYQGIRQVWFCGMHTDVGGGYKKTNLSDIPLVWMRDMAVKHGLLIYSKNTVSIQPNVNGLMHNSRGEGWTKLYPKKERFWDSTRPDKPIIHHSVLERKKNSNNDSDPTYHPWILNLKYEIEY